MANPRRASYSSNQSSERESSLHLNGGIQSQIQRLSSSYPSFIHFLKKPHAFPFLLFVFLMLTWLSLRFQHSPTHSSSPSSSSRAAQNQREEIQISDSQANLHRFGYGFPSRIAKDKRGWLLDPISIASDSGVSGGAVTCASLHLGEIRPGTFRGNHRHYSCNETFVIWGARTKFRLQNSEVIDKGYAEVTLGADEVAVAASPSGTAHALINVDPLHSTFFIGCQDSIIDFNSSSTDYKVWKDI